jgi:hypothetical protein
MSISFGAILGAIFHPIILYNIDKTKFYDDNSNPSSSDNEVGKLAVDPR